VAAADSPVEDVLLWRDSGRHCRPAVWHMLVARLGISGRLLATCISNWWCDDLSVHAGI